VSKRRSVTQDYFMRTPFRYVVMHFGENRAQRRHRAVRNSNSKKLMTPEATNSPIIRQETANA
jgi:hypothetical protein